MKRMREWFSLDNAYATAVKKSVTLGGKTFKPNQTIAYIVAEMCHSLPAVNSRRRCFSVETLANSYASSLLQLVDFEHRLKFYGQDKDEICGTIAAVEFPSLEEALKLAKAGKAVAVKVVAALFRKKAGVDDILDEIAADEKWKVSMECEYNFAQSALWDGEKFFLCSELSSEMKDLILPATVSEFNGKAMALALGGEKGEVNFSGMAMTRFAADKKAEILQAAASEGELRINVGWRNQDEWSQAVASDVPSDVREKASIVIGVTEPAPDGHVHEILTDLTVMPMNGHTHYARILEILLDGIAVAGVTSASGTYVNGAYVEHAHKFGIGKAAKAVAMEDSAMDLKGTIKFLRDQAAELKDKPEQAKKFLDRASELEKQVADEDVETIVAARIKSGDLIPKSKHEEAVAAAAKAEQDRLAKEQSDKAAAEKARAEAYKARIDKVVASKLEPKFTLGKDRTIESVVASIPAGPEGEKQFEERLEEWVELSKKTGQARASETASGTPAPKTGIPVGGGTGDKGSERKAVSFV